MSDMIRCDKCKKMMYADSRSDKGDWCTININYVDGMTTLHLCKNCHRQFLVEFAKLWKPQEYDEQYGSWWENEETDENEELLRCKNCQFFRDDSGRSYCCLHHSTMRPDGYCSLGVKSGENNN